MNFLARDITKEQLKAVQTRISNTRLNMSRAERLECLRVILGYERPIATTWDLSMADASGLIELEDDDFAALFSLTLIRIGDGVSI